MATGMAIKYHGASRVSPNQFTLQDVSARVNIKVEIIKMSFFIEAFLSVYTISLFLQS